MPGKKVPSLAEVKITMQQYSNHITESTDTILTRNEHKIPQQLGHVYQLGQHLHIHEHHHDHLYTAMHAI